MNSAEVSPPESEAGAPQPAAQVPPPEKAWRVGTLAYTGRGLAAICFWLLWGDFAWSMKDRSVMPVLQIMLGQFHASDTLLSLFTATLPAAIGLLLGPMVSFKSDRHRGARGRRIPYLLFATPISAISIVALGFSPMLGGLLNKILGSHSPGYDASVLMMMGVGCTLFLFSSTIGNAVFGALINDVVPARCIGRFFGLFRVVSLLVGAGFSYWLLGKAADHYIGIFVCVGLIYGVGVMSMCLRVKEGEYPPPASSAGGGLSGAFRATKTYFTECFSQPYYLWFFLASNLAMLASVPVNIYTVFFARSLHMSMTDLGKYFAITYIISICISYLIGSLADRFHPLRVSIVATVLYGLATLWGGIFATNYAGFAVALLAHGVLSGVFFTASASLGQRLLPQQRFAQFASASGIIAAGFNMVLPPILGGILDYSGHNYRLTYFTGSVISLLSLGCLAVVYRYWIRLGGPHGFVAPE